MAKNTRAPRRRALILAVVAVVVVGGLLYAFQDDLRPLPDMTEYAGTGFTVSYPREFRLNEYSRNAASLGRTEGREVTPIADMVIYRNDPQAPVPASYQAFIEQQARNLCGTDGGVESVTCSAVVAATTTTASGAMGQRLSMTLTRTNLTTGTTTVGAYEPIYVFNINAGAPADPTGPVYRALFIYPSIGAVLAGTADMALVQQVADTLKSPTIPVSAAAAASSSIPAAQ